MTATSPLTTMQRMMERKCISHQTRWLSREWHRRTEKGKDSSIPNPQSHTAHQPVGRYAPTADIRVSTVVMAAPVVPHDTPAPLPLLCAVHVATERRSSPADAATKHLSPASVVSLAMILVRNCSGHSSKHLHSAHRYPFHSHLWSS